MYHERAKYVTLFPERAGFIWLLNGYPDAVISIFKMRLLRPLLIYLLVVFIGAALLAPWIYWFVQAASPNSSLAHNPFHRYVNRALLILALAGIWPLLKALGLNSWNQLGLVNFKGHGRQLAQGFALGFGSLAVAAVLVLIAHARTFNSQTSAKTFISKAGAALGTAATVALLEEILFRGAIFGALRKIWRWPLALLISSMIYAIVHFLAHAEVTGPITWHSGVDLLPLMLRGFTDLEQIIPGFFNLTVAGIILGWAYQRTGNLYFSIGLHAGWIFWLKFYGFLTAPLPNTNLWFWGTEKLIDGWVAFFILSLTLLIFSRLRLEKPLEFK